MHYYNTGRRINNTRSQLIRSYIELPYLNIHPLLKYCTVPCCTALALSTGIKIRVSVHDHNTHNPAGEKNE